MNAQIMILLQAARSTNQVVGCVVIQQMAPAAAAGNNSCNLLAENN